MSSNFSISGIDGSGKSTITNLLVKSLSKKYSVIKIENPNYFIKNEKIEFQNSKFNNYIEFSSIFSQKFNNKLIIGLNNIVNTILLSRLNSNFIKNNDSDLVIYSRNLTLSSFVYSEYYLSKINKIFPKKLKYNIISNLFREKLDKIYFLDIEPSIAIERINNRSVLNNSKNNLHENLESLLFLRDSYYRNLDFFEKEFNYKYEIINVNKKTKSDIVRYIEDDINNYKNKIIL